MVENPSHEEAAPELAKWGSGLRAVGGIVAVVSASALVGGGIGMLGGVALGAINPFALGIIGAVGGSVPRSSSRSAHGGRPDGRGGGGGLGRELVRRRGHRGHRFRDRDHRLRGGPAPIVHEAVAPRPRGSGAASQADGLVEDGGLPLPPAQPRIEVGAGGDRI